MEPDSDKPDGLLSIRRTIRPCTTFHSWAISPWSRFLSSSAARFFCLKAGTPSARITGNDRDGRLLQSGPSTANPLVRGPSMAMETNFHAASI